MSKLRDLNSAIRILEHAKEEGDRFGSRTKRMNEYLDKTKTPGQIQDMKDKLYTLIQNPPARKPGEDDSHYKNRFIERSNIVERYEKLLEFL